MSILRIKLKLHFVQNVEPDPREIGFAFHRAGTEIGQTGAFCKGLNLSPPEAVQIQRKCSQNDPERESILFFRCEYASRPAVISEGLN